jgi:hypothetical protein
MRELTPYEWLIQEEMEHISYERREVIATEPFSLALRTREAIERLYVKGIYGGVPRCGVKRLRHSSTC